MFDDIELLIYLIIHYSSNNYILIKKYFIFYIYFKFILSVFILPTFI